MTAGTQSDTTTLLLVDDDPVLLAALPEALSYRVPHILVTSCTSPHQALSLIDQVQFDAVIADVKMPGMDGLTLMREITKRKPWLPVILISGHGDHELTTHALHQGAYDFLQKPIQRDALVLAVNRAIETYRLRLGSSAHRTTSTTVRITGLDSLCSTEDLRSLLKPYVQTIWTKLVVSSNSHTIVTGFAEMGSVEEAQRVIQALNGTRSGKSTLTVRPA